MKLKHALPALFQGGRNVGEQRRENGNGHQLKRHVVTPGAHQTEAERRFFRVELRAVESVAAGPVVANDEGRGMRGQDVLQARKNRGAVCLRFCSAQTVPRLGALALRRRVTAEARTNRPSTPA